MQKKILFNLLILFILPAISISDEKSISGQANFIDGDTIKINKKKLDYLALMYQKNGEEL